MRRLIPAVLVLLAIAATPGCACISGLYDGLRCTDAPCPDETAGSTGTRMSGSGGSASSGGGAGAQGGGGADTTCGTAGCGGTAGSGVGATGGGGSGPSCGVYGKPCCTGSCTEGTCSADGDCISKDVWIGAGAHTWRWNGSTWSEDNYNQHIINKLWIGPTTGWAAATDGELYRYLGSWSDDGVPLGLTTLYAAGGSSDTDVWACGKTGIVGHYDGNGWSPESSTTTGDLHAVWARTAADAWFVGGTLDVTPTIVHWDGMALAEVTAPAPTPAYQLQDVHGVAADDVWAVGSDATAGASARGGILVHWDGSTWSYVATPDPDLSMHLQGVWCATSTDCWAVGQLYDSVNDVTIGVMYHLDSTGWSRLQGQSFRPLAAVWGTSSGDVWAAGDSKAYHFDGYAWTENTPPLATTSFTSIYGR